MKRISISLWLLLVIPLAYAGRPRYPKPKAPDEVWQDILDLQSQIDKRADEGTFVTTTTANTLAAAAGTWGDAASITLAKGDWNISLNGYGIADAGTTVTITWLGIGTTSGATGPGGASNNSSLQYQTYTTGQEIAIAVPPYHVSISTSTIYYFKGLVTYSGGTAHFGGTMSAIKTKYKG